MSNGRAALQLIGALQIEWNLEGSRLCNKDPLGLTT